MRKQGPREGITRTGPGEGLIRRGPGEQFRRTRPGEQDIPDVEGHSVSDTLNRPIDGLSGGSDEILGQPRTGGELEERT
jgi:hypothetical protein